MDINRYVSVEILTEIEEKQSYSNLTIKLFLDKYKITQGTSIRELVYGVLVNKITIDFYLRKFISKGFNKIEPNIKSILRMSAYQLIFKPSMQDYGIINEAVELSKKFSKRYSSFVNGVLRNLNRKKDTLQDLLPNKNTHYMDYLVIKYSYHQSIVEYFLSQYSKEFTESLLEAGNKIPKFTIRYNSLKTNKDKIKEYCNNKGWLVEDGIISKRALTIKGDNIIGSEIFTKGEIMVQDQGSMLAVESLGLSPGLTTIDVCSAPGGKTAYMAELMENKGVIHAFDIHQHRLKLVDTNIRRTGASICSIKEVDATQGEKKLFQSADRVLVDAPCLGLGVVRKKPELKYIDITTKMEEINKVQTSILNTSLKYLKKSGVLVYSTCSIGEKENINIIQESLKNQEEYTLVSHKQYFPNTDKIDGFFISTIQKNS